MQPAKATLAIRERLAGLIQPGRSALCVLHDNPDPDSLAAGAALKLLLESAYRAPTTLAYDGMIGRAENRELVRMLGIPLMDLATLDLDRFAFVAILDSQPGNGNISWPHERPVQLVIDHHPRRRGLAAPILDIRHRYGTTTTILYEYLAAHRLEPDRRLATALLYAIKSETQDLGREAAHADRRAYFELFPKADFEALYAITHAQVDRDYFRVIARALENARVHRDALVTFFGEVGLAEYQAEVADMLLRLKGVRVTLAGAWKGSILYLSIRTRTHELNSGRLMQHLVAGLGSGGGHEMMAGGRVFHEDTATRQEVEARLATRFLRALGKRGRPSDLLAAGPKPPDA